MLIRLLFIVAIVAFTTFCLLIYMLASLNDLQFLLYICFSYWDFPFPIDSSFPFREDPSTFLLGCLVLLNSFSFRLFEKFSFYSKQWACWVEYPRLQVFSLSTLNISCHFLLACKVSAEILTDSFMGIPLYDSFSLAAFKILFCHFNCGMSWCGICLGSSCLGPTVLAIPQYLFLSSGLGSF